MSKGNAAHRPPVRGVRSDGARPSTGGGGGGGGSALKPGRPGQAASRRSVTAGGAEAGGCPCAGTRVAVRARGHARPRVSAELGPARPGPAPAASDPASRS